MTVTDAQLIRRARDDPDALAELYLRYRGPLYAWFRSRLPESAASELTAELFAQVALSLKRFRDEADGSAAPWLYGIAKNLVRRYHERGRIDAAARRRLGMPIRSYEVDIETIEDRLAAAELSGRLESALESLPEAQRAALELRVVEERSYRDVAGELGCSETAARLRVMRARQARTTVRHRPRLVPLAARPAGVDHDQYDGDGDRDHDSGDDEPPRRAPAAPPHLLVSHRGHALTSRLWVTARRNDKPPA